MRDTEKKNVFKPGDIVKANYPDLIGFQAYTTLLPAKTLTTAYPEHATFTIVSVNEFDAQQTRHYSMLDMHGHTVYDRGFALEIMPESTPEVISEGRFN